ncbi:hypothetical protein [Marinomonas posidonica]|uniref:Chromosome partition protein Smc n=1 Tax=Marinomonas posidonica (strain CECT 7376 / NCIMB 14433 / IVIA-Po-181) TaxID=491952 RepID=F6D152_MARPP|nr:hypothetical protein [Marinomonas posidonica]AEF54859.1 hypothetical protein Mar181_1821 [Marinomonas posidonica IVIA-Po-181]
MKAHTALWVPVAVGLMLSACSTTSSQDSGSGETSQDMEMSTNQGNDIPDPEQTAADSSDVQALEEALSKNQAELDRLSSLLDEKDQRIAQLETDGTSAEALLDLEQEKTKRDALESRYQALQFENSQLQEQIQQLSAENATLNEKITQLVNESSQSEEWQQHYLSALDEKQSLQQQVVQLRQQNTFLASQLAAAREEHQLLRKQYNQLSIAPSESNAREQAQAEQISSLQASIADYQAKIRQQEMALKDYRAQVISLEGAIDSHADMEARWLAMDQKLATAQANNTRLAEQLATAQASLNEKNQQVTDLNEALAKLKNDLGVLENDTISLQAESHSMDLQLASSIRAVNWQLPNEMALNNTFEILVTASVAQPVLGQSYEAELITDSEIQMISNAKVRANVQAGRLQWRWRLTGLNEKPEAEMNLLVRQQMSFNNQTIPRLVYQENQSLALINTNLFEKYGYWTIAILLGLLGGFLIGRIGKGKAPVKVS